MMAHQILMDNDVILKTCCYDAVEHVVESVAGDANTILALGVVKFVLKKAIARRRDIINKVRAADRLAALICNVSLVEPTLEEIVLAAEFEEAAQALQLALDSGESQLLAVLVTRSMPLLLTGDKRAVRAIGPVTRSRGCENAVLGRVACLEQIAMTLSRRFGAEKIQRLVCDEEAVDKALAICFSCASGILAPDSPDRALKSYISDLRREAPNVLIHSDDLSAVIA